MFNKLFSKYGHVITSFAFLVVSYSANRFCFSILHDPKMPENAKKFRKF